MALLSLSSRTSTLLASLLLASSAAVMVTGATRSSASAQTCEPDGRAVLSVSFDEPDPGEQIDGPKVVRGTARAPLVGNLEVELVRLFVDGESFATLVADEPTRRFEFSTMWDPASVTRGRHTIRVVACGTDGAWAADSRLVTVTASATGGSATTTTVEGGDGDGTSSTTTVLDDESATTSTSSSTTSTSTTSTTAQSSTTTVPPRERVDDGGGLAQLRGVRPPEEIRIAIEDDAGPPLYPAVSAGLAGFAGLTFAMGRRPRRY